GRPGLRLGDRATAANQHLASEATTDVPLRQSEQLPYSVEVPLFPAYVFCKYDAGALHSFWDISGILSMVQETDGANIIPEQEITDLRRHPRGWTERSATAIYLARKDSDGRRRSTERRDGHPERDSRRATSHSLHVAA